MGKRKRNPTIFIGVDLAWSERNPSGVAVLHGNRLEAYSGSIGSNDELIAAIGDHLTATGGAIVAIDAPLRVPNRTGARRADRHLSRDWSPFQAGAYPANRSLLMRYGAVRGEAIVQGLVDRYRFSECALIPRRTGDRLVCEVYPHPAHVSLFGLERTLKYKRGPVASRRRELRAYQRHLRRLHRAIPPLKGTKKLLTRCPVDALRGRALKEYEEILDAITCAYIASFLWWHGPAASITYGSLRDGHILVPLTGEMQRRLKRSDNGD